MRNFRELKVWEKAHHFALDVYRQTQLFPSEERFGLTVQLRKAAVSIPSNIAEGAARNSQKEFRQFLSISQGSLAELETQLIIADKLGYCSRIEPLLEELDEISKMIIGLAKSL